MLKINKDFKEAPDNRDPWNATLFEPGDILDASICYSGKTVIFYKVVSNNGKTVKAQEIGKKIVSHDGYGQNGDCVPDESKVDSEIVSGRIRKGNYLKFKMSGTCHLWNGKPVDFYTD